MNIFKSIPLLLIAFVIAACSGSQKPQEQQAAQKKTESMQTNYMDYIPSIVRIETFDNGRFLESETAFYIDSNLIAARLTPLMSSTDATVSPWNEDQKYKIDGFVAVDRINDLVLLKISELKRSGIPLYQGHVAKGIQSFYLSKPTGNTLPLHKGKIQSYGNVSGSLRYKITNQIRSQHYGTPVFADGQCLGLGYAAVVSYENQNLCIPSGLIAELKTKANTQPQPLSQLQSKADRATSEANKHIKGLMIETDFGNITIRLFNETPEYRDNFISLAKENYFDSLLVHRVINGFCIQSGAADTRYAGKNDVVGWKGPGYTMPSHVVPGFYHRRGMIGSPRKPDRLNSKQRSDGSQFYIVTGRTYSDAELDDISKETGYQFTPEQRKTYRTIGGAPHVDGTYTIFGEVISGLDVADRINQVETNTDFRPLENIRIRKISILK